MSLTVDIYVDQRVMRGSGIQECFEFSLEYRFRDRTHHFEELLAILEEDQCRDGPNTEGCGRFCRLIDVDLHNAYPSALELKSDLAENRLHHATRAAKGPGGRVSRFLKNRMLIAELMESWFVGEEGMTPFGQPFPVVAHPLRYRGHLRL